MHCRGGRGAIGGHLHLRRFSGRPRLIAGARSKCNATVDAAPTCASPGCASPL